MITAELWEAVALSLDLEPDDLRNRPLSAPSDYRTRLEIACDHLKNGKLPSKCSKHNALHPEVNLHEFAAWAQSMGWEIPNGFPRGPARSPGKPSVYSRPALKKEYLEYVAECTAHNVEPSRDQDVAAMHAAMGIDVTVKAVYALRADHAPLAWKRHARRPKKLAPNKLATE